MINYLNYFKFHIILIVVYFTVDLLLNVEKICRMKHKKIISFFNQVKLIFFHLLVLNLSSQNDYLLTIFTFK